MYKYVMEFSKTGTICYTSHLDIMRLFKRAFKKAAIKQSYSQGFNPHPKMGFAQPLSLGYIGLKEYIEFETEIDYEPELIFQRLTPLMPDGLELKYCHRLEGLKKTLAAITESASYKVTIPLTESVTVVVESYDSPEAMKDKYMAQPRIVALKKQKKKKELAEIDIKPMIRELELSRGDNELIIDMLLDSGSVSNLSPELVITTMLRDLELPIQRWEIDVTRTNIFFSQDVIR